MKVWVTDGTRCAGRHLMRRMPDRGCETVVLNSPKGLFDEEFKKRGAK